MLTILYSPVFEIRVQVVHHSKNKKYTIYHTYAWGAHRKLKWVPLTPVVLVSSFLSNDGGRKEIEIYYSYGVCG